jgi:hypothetical protein
VETASQKEKIKREISHMPEPEKQEGMPQHRHCPLAKHREGRNPKYHEEQLQGVAGTLAAQPPKTFETYSKNRNIHADKHHPHA